jgi:hypothetical protein
MAKESLSNPVLLVVIALIGVVLVAMLVLQARELDIAKQCLEFGGRWNDSIGICESAEAR